MAPCSPQLASTRRPLTTLRALRERYMHWIRVAARSRSAFSSSLYSPASVFTSALVFGACASARVFLAPGGCCAEIVRPSASCCVGFLGDGPAALGCGPAAFLAPSSSCCAFFGGAPAPCGPAACGPAVFLRGSSTGCGSLRDAGGTGGGAGPSLGAALWAAFSGVKCGAAAVIPGGGGCDGGDLELACPSLGTPAPSEFDL
mmetsp:Transcript_63641/g.160641  ORF Transcript_63641/g.160641 Transcript_63641/m.160641 type:complete len:202 (+) Transcript_63641:224-829(+)